VPLAPQGVKQNRLTFGEFCAILAGMMEDLFALGFAELPRVREPYGVYLLLDRGTVVYVGQSVNIYARLARHKSASAPTNLPRPVDLMSPDVRRHKAMVFDQVLVRWCSRNDLDRLEIELIERFRPKYNEIHANLGVVTRVDIAAIAAKLGWNCRRTRPHGELRRRVA